MFFLSGIVFAKLGLPLSEIALYETVLFASSAVSHFWVNGITSSLLSLYPSIRENKEDLFSNAFLLITAISLAFVAVLYIMHSLGIPFFKSTDSLYFFIFILYFFLTAPSFLIEYILLLKGKTKDLLGLTVVSGLMHIVFVIIPVIHWHNIRYSIFGLLIVAILRYLILLYYLLKGKKLVWDKGLAWAVLKLALPLITATLVGGSTEYIDVFMVNHLFNSSAFAIYRYGAKELPLTLLLANALSSSLVPLLSEEEGSQNLEILKNKSLRLMHFLSPLAIALMLMSKWLYSTLLSPAFLGSAIIFSTYLLLVPSRLVFPQTILLGRQQAKLIMNFAIIEVILNISFSYILALHFGIAGIAMGTVIAFTMDKVFQAFIVYKYYRILPSEYISLKPFFTYSVLLLATYILIMAT